MTRLQRMKKVTNIVKALNPDGRLCRKDKALLVGYILKEKI